MNPYPGNALWPADWGKATFRGRLIDIGASPYESRITIEPDQMVASLTSDSERPNAVVMKRPMTIEASTSTGVFSQDIPATDEPSTKPSAWQYVLKIKWVGGSFERKFSAPAGSVIELADLIEVVTPTEPVPPVNYPSDAIFPS